MKKHLVPAALAAALLLSLAGCGAQSAAPAPADSAPAMSRPADSAPADGAPADSVPADSVPADSAPAGDDEVYVADAPLRVAGLKGPTTMGLVDLIEESAAGADVGSLEFTMYGAADEIVPLLVQGELDAAAIPANLAATLYQKTEGAVQVACVNTLGVLYMLELGNNIQTVADLKGATILSTGKGTTPEYVLRHVLKENGIDPDSDVTIEYKSEATEVAALLTEPATDSRAVVAMLPQPYVTSALAQNDGVRVALDMTEEWGKVADGKLVTGVLAVRRDAVEADPARFAQFLKDYAASVDYANTETEAAAALCEKYGIVGKAALAQKALPACNIVFETGDEMKADLVSYFDVLFAADPASVGGALPGDDFYYGV